MKRTSIMLPLKLKSRAMRRAHKMKISLGKLMRESLTEFLEHSEKQNEKDPLLEDQAVFSDKGPKDLAENHDKYLYGDEA